MSISGCLGGIVEVVALVVEMASRILRSGWLNDVVEFVPPVVNMAS
jgi:hypothetical protein